MKLTEQFCAELSRDELFVQQNANFSLPSGVKRQLQDFSLVSEAKFDALSDERFLEYRKRKFLHPIYLHMASVKNWHNLADLAKKRGAA